MGHATTNSLILLAVMLSAAAVAAQTGLKVISWADHPQGSHNETSKPPLQLFKKLDAVELEEVRAEGVPIALGQPFTASPDWINHLSFRIKNLSQQPIRTLQITLQLPQLKNRPQIPYLVLGCTTGTKVCVNPGEEVELRLPAVSLYEWVKKLVAEEKLELAAIDRAEISFVLAVLEDGTQWSSGCVKTKDPKQACPEHVH
jgi:hypothetical protein